MDSQETKIRKGQAFNLAVNDAVSQGKQTDAKYIYERFIWYYSLAGVVQSSDIDMIQEVLNKPDFEAAVKKIQEVMK